MMIDFKSPFFVPSLCNRYKRDFAVKRGGVTGFNHLEKGIVRILEAVDRELTNSKWENQGHALWVLTNNKWYLSQ